jgi:hypothetical protein
MDKDAHQGPQDGFYISVGITFIKSLKYARLPDQN